MLTFPEDTTFGYTFGWNPLLPVSMRTYRAVDGETPKIEESGLCTQRVSVQRTLVLRWRSQKKKLKKNLDIYTVNGTDLVHTLSLAWYLRTFGMVQLVTVRKKTSRSLMSGC